VIVSTESNCFGETALVIGGCDLKRKRNFSELSSL